MLGPIIFVCSSLKILICIGISSVCLFYNTITNITVAKVGFDHINMIVLNVFGGWHP
jgi:hypothetical protein